MRDKVPAAAQEELGTGSGAEASSAKREIQSRELGNMGAFDVDVEGESRGERVEEVHDSIDDHRWQTCERAGANINDGHVVGCDASQWRRVRTSQRCTAGSTARALRSRERA